MLHIVILSGLLAIPARCVAGQDIQALPEISRATFRIAMSTDSAPYDFLDDTGNPSGMAVDIWRKWSQQTNIPVTFVPGTWEETLDMVKTGQVDAHAGMVFNESRTRFFDYISPLFPTQSWLFFSKEHHLRQNMRQLAGLPIGIVSGDVAEDALDNAFPKAKRIFFSDNTRLFQAVASGEIQVFVSEGLTARFFLRRFGLLTAFTHEETPLYKNTMYATVQQGNTKIEHTVSAGFQSLNASQKNVIQRRWNGIAGLGDSTVTIAMPANAPPLTFLDPKKKPSGLYVDIWTTILGALGLTPIFFPMSWPESIDAVITGKVDMHSGLFQRSDDTPSLYYSKPIHELGIGLFTRTGTILSNGLRDLNGKRVGIVESMFSPEELQKQFANLVLVPFPNLVALLRNLAAGEIDAVLADTTSTKHLLLQLGLSGLIMANGPPLSRSTVHACVSKDRKSLVDLLNSGLSTLTQTERMELERRWLDNPIDRYYKPLSHEIPLTEEEREWLDAHPTLRLVVDPSFPPVDFRSPEGAHQGISADYLTIFAEKLGISFEILPTQTWAESQDALKAGKADFSPALMATPDRENDLFFTEPYIRIPTVIIIQTTQKDIAHIDDLAGKTVAVVKGYASAEYFMNRRPEIKFVQVASPAQGLQMTALGQTDAMIINLATASWVIEHDALTGLKVAGSTDFDLALAMGSRRDTPLLNAILQRSLDSITLKQRQAIFNKWVRLEMPIWNPSRELIISIAATLGIIIIIGIWNRRLARAIRLRDAAREALLQSEERFALAIRVAADGLWDWDITTNAIYFDPGYKRMLGYDDDTELDLDTGFIQRLHPEDKNAVISRIESLLEFHGPAWVLEFRLKDRRGTFLWIEQRGHVVTRSASGTPLRAVGTHTDITSRKHADMQRAHLVAVLQNLPIAVFVTDESGHFEYINAMFCSTTGYEHDDIIGKSPDILASGQTSKHRFLRLCANVEPGKIWQGRLLNQRKDGQVYETELAIALVSNEHETARHYIAVESAPCQPCQDAPESASSSFEPEEMISLTPQQTTQVQSLAQELNHSLDTFRYDAMEQTRRFVSIMTEHGQSEAAHRLMRQVKGFAFDDARQTLRVILVAIGLEAPQREPGDKIPPESPQ
ncbi:transporter substrate-binding domain-containing protein [Desulfovibrio inopinatus]|uniref:transporter substrate-binding domain-containing protein n=1 Tax=Desulfovibrio inopinatus TaxID=102109 RepID=UPI00146FBC44|nr:transporter substrate-binding domain-containing protein [Desulfovibrio inopinatus]